MRDTGRVESRLSAATVAIGALGAQLATAAAKSAVGFGKSLFTAASDLNETVNKVNVVFGEQLAADLSKWAQDAANSFGVSREQALATAATFGNFFSAQGMAIDQSERMSKSLVQLAADMGSFNNIDPTQVLMDLQSGLAGETEPLRKYGIDISDAALQQEALAEGISKSTQEMTQAEKAQLRYNIIMRQTKVQQGDFARTAHGAANASRIFQANIADLRAELGQKLLPIGIEVLDVFNRFFDRFNDKRAMGLDVLHAALSSLHTTLDQLFGKTAGDVMDKTLRGLVDGIGNVGGAVIELGGDLVRGDLGAFFSDLGDTARELAAQGIDLGKIAVKAAIEAAGDLATWAGNLWGWVKAKLFGAPGGNAALADQTTPGFSLGGEPNATGGEGISLGDILITAGLKLGGLAAEVAGNLWGWVYGQIVPSAAGGSGTPTTGGARGVMAGFEGGGTDHVVPFGDIVVEIASWTVRAITDLATAVADKIDVWWDAAKDTAHDLGVAIVKIAGWTITQAIDLSAALAVKVSGLWDQTRSTIYGIGPVKLKVESWTATIGADLGTYLGLQLDAADIQATLRKWTLLLGQPQTVKGEDGQDAGPFLKQFLESKEFQRGFTIGPVSIQRFELAKPGIVIGAKLVYEAVVDTLTAYQQGAKVILDKWNLNIGRPTIQSLGLGLGAWLADEIKKYVPDVPLRKWNLHLEPPDFPHLSLSTVYGWIKDKFAELGKIEIPLPFDLSLKPNVTFGGEGGGEGGGGGWGDFVKGVIKGALPFGIGNLIDVGSASAAGAETSIPLAFTGTLDLDAKPAYDKLGQVSVDLTNFWIQQTWKSSLDLSDGAATDALNALVADLETGWEQDTFTASLDADIGPFTRNYTSAWTAGNAFGDQTWTSTFDVDIGPFSLNYTAAWTAGDAFGGQEWDATFGLDIAEVLTNSAAAFVIGSVWANSTYTAKFGLDTSGVALPPGFAAGGLVTPRAGGGPGGPVYTLVGERGAELVALPPGSYVYNHARTRAMLGAGGGGGTVVHNHYYVSLDGAIVGRGAQQDIERMIARGEAKRFSGRMASWQATETR